MTLQKRSQQGVVLDYPFLPITVLRISYLDSSLKVEGSPFFRPFASDRRPVSSYGMMTKN
jgi:hypothetical protein